MRDKRRSQDLTISIEILPNCVPKNRKSTSKQSYGTGYGRASFRIRWNMPQVYFQYPLTWKNLIDRRRYSNDLAEVRDHAAYALRSLIKATQPRRLVRLGPARQLDPDDELFVVPFVVMRGSRIEIATLARFQSP
jgi:hypothetical protein